MSSGKQAERHRRLDSGRVSPLPSISVVSAIGVQNVLGGGGGGAGGGGFLLSFDNLLGRAGPVWFRIRTVTDRLILLGSDSLLFDRPLISSS